MTASLLLTLGGMGVLVLGGGGVVRGAVSLALRSGLSPLFIGLSVVAFGTSSPELAVRVYASAQLDNGIATGNIIGSNVEVAIGTVVGSNIVNSLGVAGVVAIVSPVEASQVQWCDWTAMLVSGALLLGMIRGRLTLGRADGATLAAG